MKTITKTTLISLAVASAIAVAPQAAFAHKTGKSHTHSSATRSSSAVSTSSTDARLRAMEAEIQALRSQLNTTNTTAKSALTNSQQNAASEKVVEDKIAEHEAKSKEDDSTLYFRGGYAGMTHNRSDELLVSNSGLRGTGVQNISNGGAGWYIGAGIDHRLTNDLWGLTDLIALDGELMFEYKNFGQSTNTLVAGASTAFGPVGTLGTIQNQITQFTLAASPKLKFNTGTIFTPWVIPFGLSMNVISPPSSGVTVLNPGLMLGVGGEFAVWKAIVAGVDFRYNFTGGDLSYNNKVGLNGIPVRLKGMSTDGLTAGGYFGFKF